MAKVVIELALPVKNVSDFLQQWDSYRDSLIEYTGVTKAYIEMPPMPGNRIVLS